MHRVPWRDGVLGAVLLLSAAALFYWPNEVAAAVHSGMSLCGNILFPSLFPFLILSSLVVELGLSRYMGQILSPLMMPLFRVNGRCSSALVLGLLSGYPVGAKTAIQLYETGQCSKTEAERLLAFCNNCGPAFIFGAVGTGVFGSSKLGVLLYLIHVLAALLTGMIFRFYQGDAHSETNDRFQEIQAARLSSALIHCITGAMQSMLHISSFVLFFSVTIRILTCSGVLFALSHVISLLFMPFGMNTELSSALLAGFLEVSSGVTALPKAALSIQLSLAAFLLGWAGLSVHCQVISFLGTNGLSLRTYLGGKLIHGILSAGIVALLVQLHLFDETVAVFWSTQTETVGHLDAQQVLTISVAAAWLAWLLFFLAVVQIWKKRSGKSIRHTL